MQKNFLIALVVVALLVVSGLFCSKIEKNEKQQWTKSSEDLLKLKKYPKKPLERKNLFKK